MNFTRRGSQQKAWKLPRRVGFGYRSKTSCDLFCHTPSTIQIL